MALGIIVIVFVDTVENGAAQGVAIIVNPGMGVGNGVVLAVPCAAEFPVEIDLVASAAEVGITQFHDTYGAVGIGVAGAYGDDTGLLFNHIDFDDYIMFIFLARQELHVDIFEVAQVVKPFHAAAGLEFIEGLTLLQFQFPGNDLFFCLFIAYDDDIFHHPFGNIHMEGAVSGHIDGRNGNEHVALFQIEIFDFLQLLVHQYKVQYTVLGNVHDGFQVIAGENGIAGEGDIMDYRVGSQLVGNAHPFRHGVKGRGNLGEYAGGAKGSHIVTDALFRYLGAGLALYQSRKLCFDFFRNAGEIHRGNGFSHLGFNGFIVRFGKIKGGIPDGYGLRGLLHRYGSFGLILCRFIGNLSGSTGLPAGIYVNHGALGHTARGGCPVRRICKGSHAGKGQQHRGKEHCFSAF